MPMIEFQLGFYNAWWFLLVFIIINIILMVIYPSHYTKRVLKLPDISKERFSSIIYAVVLQGTMAYSIFISIKFHTIWFWFGLSLFILSAMLFFVTMHNYATTSPNKPVVKGVYKFSRNPQQILAVFMWVGVAILTKSIIMFILCILQMFLMYPTLIAQERFCIDKYKDEYIEYMKRTPRYFWKI
ncbi:MAG: methyltransferase [Bacillota bacterium]|nr:methyltransferase [Bacillota bacterium]